MTQRGRSQVRSQTATRTLVDPVLQATVKEFEDGSKVISTLSAATLPVVNEVPDAPTYEEQADGSVIIRAPQGPSVQEPKRLDEPMIFTNPTQPNVTLAGSRYKTGPGEWTQLPTNSKHYIRFINGHAAARTDQQAAKIRKHFPQVGKNQRVWEEPAPLLSEEEARKRGLEPPFLFLNGEGKVIFWTYWRDALQAFTRSYMAHQG